MDLQWDVEQLEKLKNCNLTALQICLQRFNDGFGTIMLLDMAKG